MMLLGIFRDTDGNRQENIYHTWRNWQKDTFSPATEIINIILFKISGKTYRERQENLRQLAIDFQLSDAMGLSWGELAEIGAFFEKNGKRYGLLKEFKENGIC